MTSQAGLVPAINCTITAGVTSGACSQSYPWGTAVTLTGTGSGGSTFGGWSGACGGTSTCLVSMTQARGVTAAFTAPPQTLTVSGAGTGSGTVTSQAGLTPAINCTITGWRRVGDVLAELSLQHGGDADGGRHGWRHLQRLGGRLRWHGLLRPDDVAGAQRHRGLHRTGADADGRRRRGGQRHGDVAGGLAGDQLHDHQRRGVGHVLAELSDGQLGDARRDADGGAAFSGWSGACTAATGTCSVTMSQARNVTASFAIGALTLSSMTPARGSTAGGTAVEVIGQGFVVGATTVTVGGVPAAHVAVRSTTRLSFVTPARPAGSASIAVATSNATGSRTFTFVVPDRRRLTGARRPSFSFDGRYMAFESPAALVADDTNGVADVYVFDKVTDTVRRVSVSSAGAQALGGESQQAAISATGRFVAFESRATNLVPSDGNDLLDVFLHDRDVDNDGVFDEAGAIRTIRVSVATGGVEALHGFSRNPSISGNGRWVAFETAATNLVAGDTNGRLDICVHDRLLGRTVRVNVATGGGQALDGDSLRPAISLDGRYVAFDSAASNLVADTNGRRDVFVNDRDVDGDGVMDEPGFVATDRVSVSSSEAEAVGGDSTRASITQEGRFVAFDSAATNLVANDTNGERDVFIRDRLTGDTRRLSVAPGGGNLPGPSRDAHISANGARLVFVTSGSNAGTAAPFSASAIVAAVDDGKSTSGSIPSPTTPDPPPPVIDPVPPTGTVEDPNVSGDGSSSGTPVPPGADGGSNEPVIVIDELPEAPEDPPFISGLGPVSGPMAGGQLVEIQGAGFAPGAVVRWGSQTLAPLAGGTPSLLRVITPASASAVAVEVQVQAGQVSSNVVIFTYQVAQSTPVITSVDPASGPVTGQQSVTIHGTGFDAASVRFGAFAATITGGGVNAITVTTPETIVAGPVPVIVTNTDGGLAVLDGAYTYLPVATGAPTITVVQPATGPAYRRDDAHDPREPVHRPGDGARRRRGGDAGAVPEQLGARRHDVAVAGRSEPAVGHRAGAAARRPCPSSSGPCRRPSPPAPASIRMATASPTTGRRSSACRRPIPATPRRTGTATAAPTPRNAWIERIPAGSTRGISRRVRPGRSSRPASPWPTLARCLRACCSASSHRTA